MSGDALRPHGRLKPTRSFVALALVAVVTATSLAAALTSPLAGAPDPIAGRPIGELNLKGMRDAAFAARVSQFLAQHGANHPQRVDLQGATPLEAAREIVVDEAIRGQTPAQWIAGAKAEALLALRADAPAAPADLVAEVARLETLAVGRPTPFQLDEIRAQAANVPADVAPHFAALVRAVADAYEVQLALAQPVLDRADDARLAVDLIVTDDERAAMHANALRVVAAQNEFRLATDGMFESVDASGPLFRDPLGLVILGGTGADAYVGDGTLRDPILLVEPSGDDTYANSAGGACPEILDVVADCNGLALSLVVDLDGADAYAYDGEPSVVQGGGAVGGVGILVDVAGNDRYSSVMERVNRGPLFDYVDGGSQGYGEAGVGILIDALGDDVYEATVTSTTRSIWLFSQGFGGAGGLGLIADGSGDDLYDSKGLHGGELNGFQGLYPNGVSIWAGVGIQTDTGLGNDRYYAYDNAETTDYYAQGFGAFGGLGILFEDGGDDDYSAVEEATDPFIIPLLNCAYGTGSYAGVGIMIDVAGNDRYYGDSISPREAYTMNEGFGGPGAAYGVFVDVSGDDGHIMYARGAPGSETGGRGVLMGGGAGTIFGNTAGIYVDSGGNDIYVGAAPSRDNGQWAFGADVNAAPGLMLLPPL